MSTTSVSRGAVDRAGKRIASGNELPGDRDLIADFRDECTTGLLPTCKRIEETLGDLIRALSARPKRTASIVRKCIKLRIKVSEMDDLIGFRIVVGSRLEQDEVCLLLRSIDGYRRTKSYLEVERIDGYRAIHELFDIPPEHGRSQRIRFEVQVRTMAQHLWACTSEALGLHVKEGGGPPEIRLALNELGIMLKLWEQADEEGAEELLNSSVLGDRQYFVLLADPGHQAKELLPMTGLGEAVERIRFYESSERIGQNRDAVLLLSALEHPDQLTHLSYDHRKLVAILDGLTGIQVPRILTSKLLSSM